MRIRTKVIDVGELIRIHKFQRAVHTTQIIDGRGQKSFKLVWLREDHFLYEKNTRNKWKSSLP